MTDSEANPKLRDYRNKWVALSLRFRKIGLRPCWFIALDYDQVMTLLVGSGASHNFVKLAALKNTLSSYESLCRDGKREEATVRLASGALVKLEEVQVELSFSLVISLVKRSLQC